MLSVLALLARPHTLFQFGVKRPSPTIKKRPLAGDRNALTAAPHLKRVTQPHGSVDGRSAQTDSAFSAGIHAGSGTSTTPFAYHGRRTRQSIVSAPVPRQITQPAARRLRRRHRLLAWAHTPWRPSRRSGPFLSDDGAHAGRLSVALGLRRPACPRAMRVTTQSGHAGDEIHSPSRVASARPHYNTGGKSFRSMND